jgi:hypothetical protein
MGLIANRPWKYGLNTTYWAIETINLDFVSKIANVTLLGYVSEDSKKINHDPNTDREDFEWRDDQFTFTKGGNNIEEAYNKIVEPKLDEEGNNTNEFSTAEAD